MSQAAPQSTPLVKVQNLTRRYGDVLAVDDVSFEVQAGEIFGLLGPNGAGKSTTLRMLATLLTPDEGQAEICGFDLQGDTEAIRYRIGYQTGDTRLYERLRPEEFLRYFGRLHNLDSYKMELRIDELVDLLDLKDFLNRACGTLSTGQQQRVSLARALLHDPPVLILDEPTSGLDIISSQFILQFLRDERERGKAILYSTHIMSEAELLCDRLGLLYKGRMMRTGMLSDLLTQTNTTSLTRAFLQSIAQEDDTAAEAAALEASLQQHMARGL